MSRYQMKLPEPRKRWPAAAGLVSDGRDAGRREHGTRHPRAGDGAQDAAGALAGGRDEVTAQVEGHGRRGVRHVVGTRGRLIPALGKSTLAAVLGRRGLISVDADNDPLLARSVDAVGNVVAEEPAEPDFDWLSRHSWAWDPARLDTLIRAAGSAALYVCGGAANELELADRFAHMFLLEIDESTMLARVDARRDNDWGHIGDTREYLRRFLPR